MRLIKKGAVYQMHDVVGNDYIQLIHDGWASRQEWSENSRDMSTDARTYFITTRPKIAAKYAQYATDEKLRASLSARHKERVEKIRPSFAVKSDIEIPVPEGLEYRPYQKAGIAYAAPRTHTLIADSMRLGKTIQGIGACNYWRAETVLIVCPATAKVNWKREWDKWNTRGLEATIVTPIRGGGLNGADDPVIIMNYDLLQGYRKYIFDRVFDVVIFDESKALINFDATRTKLCYGSESGRVNEIRGLQGARYISMDGTPWYSKTIHLWPVCRFMDPMGLGASRFQFGMRYCDGKKVDGRWDFSGSSNLEELQERMRAAFMVRREKQDVVADIPPNRQTHVIPADGLLVELVANERAEFGAERVVTLDHIVDAIRRNHDVTGLLERISRYDMIDRQEANGDAPPEEEPLASARKQLALAKVPHVAAYVRELLETRDKVVIMAHHRDVVTALTEEFEASHGAVKLYGGMSAKARQEALDAFKDDPNCRVFVGNIISAGQAISLAAADDIVFAELSWVPAEMDQAEERVWDPLKTSPCSIHRVVVEDSLDEAMTFILDRRQRDIAKALKVRALLDTIGEDYDPHNV